MTDETSRFIQYMHDLASGSAGWRIRLVKEGDEYFTHIFVPGYSLPIQLTMEHAVADIVVNPVGPPHQTVIEITVDSVKNSAIGYPPFRRR